MSLDLLFSSLSSSPHFLLLLSLSLSLCPCLRVLWWLLLSLVCMFLWSWCVRAVWCGVARWKPPCFNTSPCAPARRPQVVTLAGVVPVHTGDVSNVHTGGTHGERSGVERVEVEISVTHQHQHQHQHTPTHPHCTPTTHTTHKAQHRARKVLSPVLLTRICPREVTTWP